MQLDMTRRRLNSADASGANDRSESGAMGRVIIIWEAPRFRGTVLAFALVNGLKAAGSAVLLDEPLHWRKFRLGGLPPEERRLDALAETIRYERADCVIIKMQAKQAFSYRPPAGFADHPLIASSTNVVLVRDASAALASHMRALDAMTDIPTELTTEGSGIPQLHAVHIALAEAGRTSFVVDTDIVARCPETAMRELAAALEVPFSQGMVAWQGVDLSPPPWGAHWYEDLIVSTGWRETREPSDCERRPVAALVDFLAPLLTDIRGSGPIIGADAA